MRTTGRSLVATAVLGAGLFLAAPASAQTATVPVCPYPFDNCPAAPANPTPPDTTTPIGGGGGGPAEGEAPDGADTGGAGTGGTGGAGTGGTGGAGTGGGGAVVDNSPVRGSAGGAASLPFTGGEVTLIALTGLAALGGGVALVAAGRKRAQV